MSESKKYWKGLEELNQEPEFLKNAQNEFPEYLSSKDAKESEGTVTESSRRDFLKLMGFSVAAVSLAACEAPVRKAIPYVVKPEDVEPGVPNFYASSYVSGSSYASILVKTREGRPIKIEGNNLSSVTKGAVNAQIHASVLSLYDKARLSTFTKGGSKISISDADKSIVAELNKLKAENAKVTLVTPSIYSPSTKAVIAQFIASYPNVKHVSYDVVSASALIKAYGGVIPSFRFDKAKTIVSFGADFLSTWLSPLEYAKQYSVTRKLTKDKKEMSCHYQFEAGMTLTGANADFRIPVKPSEEAHYVVELYNRLAAKTGNRTYSTASLKFDSKLDKAASDLYKNKGNCLVVSSSNDESVQLVVKAINDILGNRGNTVDLDSPLMLKQATDDQMYSFVSDLASGNVKGVIFYNCNPVYDHAKGSEIAKAVKSLQLSVSIADRSNETSSLTTFICADQHTLESWGDAEPKKGFYSLIQPTISPVFKETRCGQESLLVWAGNNTSYYDFVKSIWRQQMFPRQTKEVSFTSFWDSTLHDGVFEPSNHGSVAVVAADSTSAHVSETQSLTPHVVSAVDLSAVVSKIGQTFKPSKGIEIVAYESTALGTGDQSNNPWLQELPDPISKVCWDNYLAVNPSDAKNAAIGGQALVNGDVVEVSVGGKGKVSLPVLLQPGQAKGSASVAIGYGRTKSGQLASGIKYANASGEKVIGSNVFPLLSYVAGSMSYVVTGASIKATGTRHKLAQTQTHQTIMGRDSKNDLGIIQESTLSKYQQNLNAGRVYPKISTSQGKKTPNEVDIWAAPNEKGGEVKTHTYNNHHWGLVIDLNSCTGCSACMVSCQAENNVPVVGKDEVLRSREMHWLRIDRYYSSREEDVAAKAYVAMETPEDNPEVVFQPMMCQHCNHAPCETVCPVAATTHSSEGLNQMTYNRCIGTRYCANNCPYKVRRFNWFTYYDNHTPEREFGAVNVAMNDDLGKMVLNPDVTVRARGVMEKCSLCVQRIQSGKLKAKIEGRSVEDGEITTACASSCPTDAIVFGDLNDSKSRISKIINDENAQRNYYVLEEINVKPNVSYLTKIRNK